MRILTGTPRGQTRIVHAKIAKGAKAGRGQMSVARGRGRIGERTTLIELERDLEFGADRGLEDQRGLALRKGEFRDAIVAGGRGGESPLVGFQG